MEDEQQSTLKKKIQILFQLGKWTDVVKLCDSYGEKYGKDEEIELIRFKSERHMGIPVPKASPAAQDGHDFMKSGASPRSCLPKRGSATMRPPFPLPLPRISWPLHKEKFAYDSSPEADDLDVGDPFPDDELVITDPFTDDKLEFSLAPDQPPVVISDPETAPVSAIFGADELELSEQAAARSENTDEDREPDFENIGAMTLDAEPDLGSPGLKAVDRSEPQPEPAATMFMPAMEKTPDDRPRPSGSYFDAGEEPQAARSAPTAKAEEVEKSRRPSVPVTELIDQKAPARKKVISPKLLLLVVLPLVAATALWLALSGKLDFSGPRSRRQCPSPWSSPRL